MPWLTLLAALFDAIDKMARKKKAVTLDEIASALGAHSFEVSRVGGGLRAVKYGVAAEVVPVAEDSVDRQGAVVAYRQSPGVLVGGQIARLLDRGYQKFIANGQYEFPATAEQLRSIHQFSEELSLVTGGVSLYNESLGTTSDVYEYDRVKGRDASPSAGVRPWEQAAGH